MRKFVRSFVIAAALVAPLSVASAQGDGFKVGTKILSIGLLGGGTGFGIGAGAAYEVGVKELAPEWTLGVGGFVGFTSKSYDCGPACSYSFRAIPIDAIGNVHYRMKDNPKLDLYGGLSVGFTNFSASSSVNGFDYGLYGNTNSGLGIGGQVGARYDFTPKLGGFLQLGGGSNTAVYFIGVNFKM